MTAPAGRALGGGSLTREQLYAAPVRLPRPALLAAELDAHPRTRDAAAVLGIHTIGDLLEHVPAGHEFRATKAIAQLKAGDEATIEADVRSITVRQTRRRNFRIVEALVADPSGSVKAVWFNQAYLVSQLPAGTRLRLFGKVKSGTFQVREHSVLGKSGAIVDSEAPAGGIIAVYPGTEGLKSQRLRELVAERRGLELNVVEPLPGRLRAAERLLDRPSALAEMHFPRGRRFAQEARERLAFEELLMQQIALGMRRRRRAGGRPATELPARETIVASWRKRLPFALTADQLNAIEQIDADLTGGQPMQRLLMGEVGSGKTVVALAAMLRAAENGCQAALMAPTETLAEQHFATLDAMLPEVPLALLTGSTPAARRREILARLASGELPLIVGTHALIEPTVQFRVLALAVVDEQHRFGVRQRAALDEKAPAGRVPHVLHMTATPIPRTLALTGYGDLDFTLIKQLPGGRRPVQTRVVADLQRAAAYDEVREQLRGGRQAYVVCPLVEDSDELQARAATSEAERLAAGEFKDFRVGLIHGQMAAAAKTAAMRAFSEGETDVLVATSVVEVGIDVPNATVMIIEDAERYGISQLHQLRGRIGRGEHESVCMLFGFPAARRLRAVANERDGFKLAQIDLELRGSGEELGTRQSGLPRFRVAVLPEDTPLLERARRCASRLLSGDPQMSAPEHELLREAVTARYGDEIDPIPA
ncbi:MAG: ATP-dependent DNA helicase RecG [Actinobacteria bacterium]|nr:ATP-dependent DNA helicase RecG [Actinomycetota bacterium]